MGRRIDRLRGLLGRAADQAVGDPVRNLRAAVREIRERRARISERDIARAVLRAGTVAAASVRTRDGRIEISAELESGRVVTAALVPASVTFAPRGAKEIVFAVEPAEAAGEPKLRDIVGQIAARVARVLWAPLLAAEGPEGDPPALVDREDGRLRVDLRTCPAVRAVRSETRLAMLDVLGVESLLVDEQGLSLRIGLPRLPG